MRYALIIITVIVSAIILFSVLPVVGVANTVTKEDSNEGASDMKFSLEKNKSFERTYRFTGDEITVTGGSDSISVPMRDMIVYADDNLCILSSGYRFYLIADGYMSPAPNIGQNFTIKNNNGIKITPGWGANVGTLIFAKPTWCYLPNSDGAYAYFDNGTGVTLTEGAKEAVAGLYGGWGAYNRLAYTISTDRTEDHVSVAQWTLEVEGSTSYTAPSPVLAGPYYTDGYWTYAVPDGENATITAYNGPGGDVTVPATVGGYPVMTIGTGGGSGYVFQCNLSSLTISEGIKNIAGFSIYQSTGYSFTGTLTLPESLEYIGAQSFRFATFEGNLTIPKNVGYIGYNAFEGGNYTTLAVESSAIPLSNAYLSTPIEEVLNLGDAPYTPYSWGLSANSVNTDVIQADGFIANENYTYQASRTGTIAMLFWLIPLVFLIGLAIFFINRINNHNQMSGGWRK